jgi:hypothetical protein
MNGDQEELVVVTEEEYVCLNVKDLGATGDGKTNDTAHIQGCILSEQGESIFSQGRILYRSIIFEKQYNH